MRDRTQDRRMGNKVIRHWLSSAIGAVRTVWASQNLRQLDCGHCVAK